MDKRRALTSRLLWGAVLIASLAWMVAFFFYVEEAIGWQNAVGTLLPHEIAAMVLALVVPPLLLITVIAAFRGQMISHHRLHKRMQPKLMLPDVRQRIATQDRDGILQSQ